MSGDDGLPNGGQKRITWTDLFGIDPEYASVDRLHGRLGEALDGARAALDQARADLAALQDRMAAVRRALDDELANLADDGARLSHSVVRRIEAALYAEDQR